MTGKENIEIGDWLVPFNPIHSIEEVVGVTDTSINLQCCETSWRSRKDFNWEMYRLEKHKPTQKILDYQKVFKKVKENNKKILEKRRKELQKLKEGC